jgi:hypothetical protein
MLADQVCLENTTASSTLALCRCRNGVDSPSRSRPLPRGRARPLPRRGGSGSLQPMQHQSSIHRQRRSPGAAAPPSPPRPSHLRTRCRPLRPLSPEVRPHHRDHHPPTHPLILPPPTHGQRTHALAGPYRRAAACRCADLSVLSRAGPAVAVICALPTQAMRTAASCAHRVAHARSIDSITASHRLRLQPAVMGSADTRMNISIDQLPQPAAPPLLMQSTMHHSARYLTDRSRTSIELSVCPLFQMRRALLAFGSETAGEGTRSRAARPSSVVAAASILAEASALGALMKDRL